jgi:hypothetical protein
MNDPWSVTAPRNARFTTAQRPLLPAADGCDVQRRLRLLAPYWAGLAGLAARKGAGHEAEDIATEAIIRAALSAVHSNGPLPLDFQAGLWREVPGCRVLVARSSQLVAPDVAVWPDTDKALREVSAAVEVARTAAADTPVVLVGLGAGAGVATSLAVALADRVAGAVAVAPPFTRQGPHGGGPAGGPRSRPSVVVLTGDGADSVASSVHYQSWVDANRVRSRMAVVPGLGCAFPRDFGRMMREALDWIVDPPPDRAGAPHRPLTPPGGAG